MVSAYVLWKCCYKSLQDKNHLGFSLISVSCMHEIDGPRIVMALVGNYSNSTTQTGSNFPLFKLYAKEELVIATIIEICLAAVGTFGNCTVSVAVVKNRALHVASNFYMVSLALADLLVTAFLVPMRAAQHLALFNGSIVEEAVVCVLGFIGRITILASVSSIAALSMDRRMALKHPLKYLSVIRFAKGRAVKVILTIWVLSLAFTSLTLIPGVDDEVYLIGFASYVLMVFAVILFAYANILYLVRQSTRWRISTTSSRSNAKKDAKGERPFRTGCMHLPMHRREKTLTPNSATSRVDTEVTCAETTQTRSTNTIHDHDHENELDSRSDGKLGENKSPESLHGETFSVRKEQNENKASSLQSGTEAETEMKHRKRKLRAKVSPAESQGVFQSHIELRTIEKASVSCIGGEENLLERKRQRNTYSGRAQLKPLHLQRKPRTFTIPVSLAHGKTTNNLEFDKICRGEVESGMSISRKKQSMALYPSEFSETSMVSSCDQRTQLPRKTLPKSVLENHSDSKLSPINDARARKRQRESQLEFKILKTTGLIVMLFFVLVFPRIVVIIYSISAGNDLESVIHARLWMRILLYCNSAVNPFLYSLRHREIWREFMKLVRCCYWGTGRRQART